MKLLLCGQAPETAFASALASVQFYVAQQQLQSELKETQLTKKIGKVQDACRKKLEEVHNGYVQVRFLGGSLDPNSPGGALGTVGQGLRRTGSGNSFGAAGGGMHMGGGGGNSSQDNNALRKMLGMPPAQNGMAGGRGMDGMRNDLFSM
ncbi:hypothetical protein GPECTOR_1g383 [Gonium pectorale]|uniref:Uncharacterized protein n=1 Tax=Gonium pectorale TaxID=33097 RepID=A0A150H4C7_GONPE|nr:hypothetical protein GPECTOR_1g383 [Gonium pectorale]|eukprot:KXZ56430.1 hypothetical protein GPECTOR_1g383 [Gonium pectorale]